MTFERFIKFSREFSIFPDILSRAKLMQLFYNLATLQPILQQKSQDRESLLNEQLKTLEASKSQSIDENLFTEALAMCATEIEDSVLAHPIEKVSQVWLHSA